jgi:hypothetical protein
MDGSSTCVAFEVVNEIDEINGNCHVPVVLRVK